MQKRDNNKKEPNNFFNQSPMLTFVIFAIVTIVLFKSLSDDTSSDATSSKSVTYYELKKMIETKQLDKVLIGNTIIKGISNKGGQKVIYQASRVSPDGTLIPLLDKNKITYSGYSETNWLSELIIGWVLPIIIFFGIWMFLKSFFVVFKTYYDCRNSSKYEEE